MSPCVICRENYITVKGKDPGDEFENPTFAMCSEITNQKNRIIAREIENISIELKCHRHWTGN